MGKSSNTQPNHSTIGAVQLRPYTRRRGRSKTISRYVWPCHTDYGCSRVILLCSRQRDSTVLPTKPSSPTANDLPLSRTPSLSPLITSLSEQYFDAEEDFSSSDEEDVFYDAEDMPSELHKPVLATVHQIDPEPQYDGAAKGRIDRRQPPSASRSTFPSPATPTQPAFASAGFFGRGSAKPAATAPGPFVATRVAEEALRAVPPTSFPPRGVAKKAVLVGINYAATLSKDKRLYYAVRDAKLWHKTLLDKGVSSDNIKVLTDSPTDEASEMATCQALLKYIRWLVHGAQAGDTLLFAFSGHAVLTPEGPAMVACDKVTLPRWLLHQELVMSIPAGVDLQVVFDCCHSAGMISLQYCVGRMLTPTLASEPSAEESTACPSESSESQGPEQVTDTVPPRSSSPYSHAPQHASLYGISPAADVPQRPAPPVTPDMVDMDTFGAPPQRPPRGGVVAAPPMQSTAGNQPGPAVGAVRYLTSWMGLGSTSAPTPTQAQAQAQVLSEPPAATMRQPTASGPRRACQGYVKPAGKVMVWAGTGVSQQAFEAYGGAKQGIVTKAMCAALASCVDRVGTCRELWRYLVQEIEVENNYRQERDASKNDHGRVPRVQHAELWVSQSDPEAPLRSAAPVLDQPLL
ncbi:caspase domain-containing protein [Rhizoctonia solani]|nr:caspase domain-containing protein [Rhizoctonia solani]